MKKMRLPLFIILGMLIILIIIGSFNDLNISKAIANKNNYFAIAMSATIPTISFSLLSLIGGAFIQIAKKDYDKRLKILFIISAIIIFILSIYFSGREYFGINGFYRKAPEYVGFFIPIIPLTLSAILGYHLFKNNNYKYSWVILYICIAAILVPYVFFIEGLKLVMHRPRFRVVNEFIPFKNWWESQNNYKDLITAFSLSKDEFKSFPSGHTGEAVMIIIVAVFLPLANEKLKKYQILFFIISVIILIIMALSRIMAAAHYLTDVSFGALFLILSAIIFNEITIKLLKRLNEKAPE